MLGRAALIIASALILIPTSVDAAKIRAKQLGHSASSACQTCKIRTIAKNQNRTKKSRNTSQNNHSLAPDNETGAVVAGRLTAYSPQRKGDRMEGGYASSRPGPDRKSVVRTLADVAAGRSAYVTIAGSPKFYGRHYRIPSIQFVDALGRLHTLKDVTAVVHDTGSAFRRALEGRFDMPVERDIDNKLMVRNATLWKAAGISLIRSDRKSLANADASDIPRETADRGTKTPKVRSASGNELFRVSDLTIRAGVKSDAPYMRRKRFEGAIRRIIVHGDVNENAEVLLQYGRRIDRQRGFDANYHFYIARDATITQGVPLNRVAQHAYQANADSIGIVLAGVDNGRMPTARQEWAAKALIASLGAAYRICHTKVFGHGELQPERRNRLEGGHVARDVRTNGYHVPATPPLVVEGPASDPTPVIQRGITHHAGMESDAAPTVATVTSGDHFDL